MNLRARKTLEPDGGVAPSEAGLDEMVDVAVYAEHPSVVAARPVHAGKYRLRTGETSIVVTVKGKAAFVSVDPFERPVEMERADNVKLAAPRK